MTSILNRKVLLAGVIGICTIALAIFVYFFPYIDRIISVNGYRIVTQDRTTSQQWQKGLSDRNGLCDRCGMLFLFPHKQKHGFWMKDMRFDIDIIWLDDGRVMHVESRVSHQTPEVIYKPDVDVNAVLELPAGKAAELNVDVGTVFAL